MKHKAETWLRSDGSCLVSNTSKSVSTTVMTKVVMNINRDSLLQLLKYKTEEVFGIVSNPYTSKYLN